MPLFPMNAQNGYQIAFVAKRAERILATKNEHSVRTCTEHEAEKMAKISVFGIGYVGVVSAACLARDGHSVIAVDVDPGKIESINAGQTPIV
ncbi:MAG: hypothetical protein MK160_10735, partial [Rhodobacteraceae bacterium]|nr:hypothetical protein [Paracoccaceae bacterium]